MHRKTAEWACRHAQGHLWEEYRQQISDASTYPDEYVFGEDAEDKTGWDADWRELVLIPQAGKRIPMHRVYETTALRDTYPAVVRYLVNLALEAWKAGNPAMTAKAAGTLTHLTGDTFQVAHATDNRMVLAMYPFRGNQRFMIHQFMESVLCDIDPAAADYRPRELGWNAESLVWRIVEEMEIGRMNSIAEIPILMGALQNGDLETAVASAVRTATACAKLDADIFQSIYAITQGKTKPIQPMPLTQLRYKDVQSDNLFNYEAMIDYIPGRTREQFIPLDIGYDLTKGLCVMPIMAQSYSMVRDAWITYSVEGCGYSRFRCQIGIQHFQNAQDVPFGVGNQTACVFEIRLDGKTVYQSKALSEQDAAESVDISLDGTKELTLYVRDVRGAHPLTKFVYPVFARPELVP